MRLTVITPSFPTKKEPYRGAPTWATLRHLQERAELSVLCTNPLYPVPAGHRDFFHDAPELGDYPEIAARTVRFPALPLVSRALNGWTLTKVLEPLVRAERPDVLLTYWIYPEGYAAVRIGQRLGIPTVVVSLGSDLKRIPRDPLLRKLTAFTVREADRTIGVSGDLAAVAGRLGGRPERMRVVFNGVRTELFQLEEQQAARAQVGVGGDARLVLYVGRFVPLKGIPNLVKAVRGLSATDPRWQLALIGNGSQEAELRAQVAAAGMTDRVRFLGPLAPEQVAKWMNAADLLCLPSESEGQPNVIVEALSCGRPVVATAVGGIPEIVTPDSGVLMQDNAADTVAAALTEAIQQRWDRGAIAKHHRRSWADAATDTLAICEEAAAEHSSRMATVAMVAS